VVAPHPDDETLGAGGLMQRVLERGGSVRIVLVTAGDGFVEAVAHETRLLRPPASRYVAYGRRRLAEARAAIRVFDSTRVRLQFLGFPDGGLRDLLRAHWTRAHPERSHTTGAADPPYDEAAIEPDLPYDGADLRRELVRLLKEDAPTIVAFPDPVDRHPDHRAAGLFTCLALADVSGIGATSTPSVRPPVPRLLAYLVHWPDWPPGWDAKTPVFDLGAPLHLPANLPPRNLATTSLTLSDTEIATKRAALARYRTQQEEMAPLLAGFVRRTEPFTVFTVTQLQHVARLIEEQPPTPTE